MHPKGLLSIHNWFIITKNICYSLELWNSCQKSFLTKKLIEWKYSLIGVWVLFICIKWLRSHYVYTYVTFAVFSKNIGLLWQASRNEENSRVGYQLWNIVGHHGWPTKKKVFFSNSLKWLEEHDICKRQVM